MILSNVDEVILAIENHTVLKLAGIGTAEDLELALAQARAEQQVAK